jgi:hypothetical protein
MFTKAPNYDALTRESWRIVSANGIYCVAFRSGIEAVFEWGFEENGWITWGCISSRKCA